MFLWSGGPTINLSRFPSLGWSCGKSLVFSGYLVVLRRFPWSGDPTVNLSRYPFLSVGCRWPRGGSSGLPGMWPEVLENEPNMAPKCRPGGPKIALKCFPGASRRPPPKTQPTTETLCKLCFTLLARSWRLLGLSWGLLGRSCGLLGRSWAQFYPSEAPL